MVATLLSIVVAVLLRFYPLSNDINPIYLSGLMLLLSIILLLLFFISLILSWGPLQQAELHSSPRIMEMFRKDWHVRLSGAWAAFFVLATFVLIINLQYNHLLSVNNTLMLWTVMFGITLDVSWHYIKRVSGYLNPFTVVTMFTTQARASVQEGHELDLCHWIDGLSEMAIKGAQRHSTSVCNLALTEEEEISRLFLDASKSIAHQERDPQTRAMGIKDKVPYTMMFLYQRLDSLFEKALHNHLETTCSQIITTLGKISVNAAKYDVSLASAPLRFIGKCGMRAQDSGMEEAALTASCTLFEVGKAILTEIDISYYEIKDAFLSIINGMEMLAKGAFKRDKSMNLMILIQPFKDLKTLFETGKAKEHQDTPAIITSIDRVIGEFEALQTVMATMPPIPSFEGMEKGNSMA